MHLPNATRLLSEVAVRARRGRREKELPASFSRQVTPAYAEIWLPTAGCSWDAIGHCTTCNYGIARPVPPSQMYQAVALAVEQLAPTTQTVWVSAYNTLFEREVPAEARRAIFQRLARTNVTTVITETHPLSVRAEVIRECVAMLDGRTLGVELGVETTDEFVRHACLNKPFTNARLSRSIDVISAAGATTYANLLVGIPFLSEAEVIADISRSIGDVIKMGCERVVLFRNHVKDHTIAALLAEAGRYDPPDLWTMKAVVGSIPRSLWSRVILGWLDPKDHPGAARVTVQPQPSAEDELHRLFVEFGNYGTEQALAEAVALEGPRRVRGTDRSLVDRILENYRWLAENFGEEDWWVRFGETTGEEIRQAYLLSELHCLGESHASA